MGWGKFYLGIINKRSLKDYCPKEKSDYLDSRGWMRAINAGLQTP